MSVFRSSVLKKDIVRDLKLLMTNDSGQFLIDSIDDFSKKCRRLQKYLEVNREKLDYETIAHTAHKIAGSSAILGVMTLYEISIRIENAARGQDTTKIMQEAKAFDRHFSIALDALREAFQMNQSPRSHIIEL